MRNGRKILKQEKREEGDKMRREPLCDFCSGKLVKKNIDLDFKLKNGSFIIIRNVNTLVCSQCKESYLDEDMSVRINNFINEIKKKKPIKYIPVPVFAKQTVIGKQKIYL